MTVSDCRTSSSALDTLDTRYWPSSVGRRPCREPPDASQDDAQNLPGPAIAWRGMEDGCGERQLTASAEWRAWRERGARGDQRERETDDSERDLPCQSMETRTRNWDGVWTGSSGSLALMSPQQSNLGLTGWLGGPEQWRH